MKDYSNSNIKKSILLVIILIVIIIGFLIYNGTILNPFNKLSCTHIEKEEWGSDPNIANVEETYKVIMNFDKDDKIYKVKVINIIKYANRDSYNWGKEFYSDTNPCEVYEIDGKVEFNNKNSSSRYECSSKLSKNKILKNMFGGLNKEELKSDYISKGYTCK